MKNLKQVLAWKGHPWFPLIWETYLKLTLLMPGYEVLQIKEKWGSLRFYVQVPRYMLWLNYRTKTFEKLLDYIYEILDDVEERSFHPAPSSIVVDFEDLNSEEYERGFDAGVRAERAVIYDNLRRYLELTREDEDEPAGTNVEWDDGFQAAMALVRGMQK